MSSSTRFCWNRVPLQLRFVIGTIGVVLAAVLPGDVLDRHPGLTTAPSDLGDSVAEAASNLEIDAVSVYLWDHPVPNAIPLGTPHHGILVLSTELVALLDRDALEAAVYHELGHIRAGHSRRIAIVSSLVGFGWLWWSRRVASRCERGSFAHRIIGVVVGVLLLLAHSRRCERQADRLAVAAGATETELARAILIIRTGNPTITVSSETLRAATESVPVLSMYPRLDRRFPGLMKPQPSSTRDEPGR